MRVIKVLLTAALIFACSAVWVQAADYNIGIYYFPGWVKRPGTNWNPPWDQIKPFPEREPLLGWYPEGEVWVAEKHIDWLQQYGADFIIYDWYWTKESQPGLEHALQAYLKAKNRDKMKFTIMWANHFALPETMDQFTSMVDYWIRNYFKEKQYVTIDGKPVVYIFSPEELNNNARRFGMTSGELLTKAREMARKAGYRGIYFVACIQAIDHLVLEQIPGSGYDATSGYSYHRGYSGRYEKGGLSTSFAELAAGYKQSWEWILKNGKLPYFVPVTAGWDKKPWGSRTPHDESGSDPASFRRHLQEAKRVVDRYPEKCRRTVVIYSWNEFGEGSAIEPTKKWQFQYLQAVKDVFR